MSESANPVNPLQVRRHHLAYTAEHLMATHKLGIVAYRRHIAELKVEIAIMELGGETIDDDEAGQREHSVVEQTEIKARMVLLYRNIQECERSIETLERRIAAEQETIRALRTGFVSMGDPWFDPDDALYEEDDLYDQLDIAPFDE